MQDDGGIEETIRAYYERFDERGRLTGAHGELEFVRSTELLGRFLPPSPAVVLDVGGAAGRYSVWLARQGYEAHLVDPVPALVEQAKEEPSIRSCTVGDARSLPFPDEFADAALLFGPLYHLTRRADRMSALGEARRVLKPGGILCAAAISRFASALDGLFRGLVLDPDFVKIMERDLRDGRHHNPTGNLEYFTDAYFHHPGDLLLEAEEAGLADVEILAVEGAGAWLANPERYWDDPERRQTLLRVIRRLETEPALLGASPHLMCIGRNGASS